MANTLKSWMILNNVTADIPAAGTTGAHDFDTTSTVLRPYYDDGSNKVPWRANFSHTLYATNSVSVLWTLGSGSGEAFGAGNHLNCFKLDFSRFRQARIYAVAKNRALSAGAVTIKIVDITNTQDITSTISFPNDAAWYRLSSTWANLNSATYAGDAEFEMQCDTGSAGDLIDFGTIMLELR